MAEEIFFPTSSSELSSYFKLPSGNSFCVSGARTGVVGGAVPKLFGSSKISIVSLTKLKSIGKVESFDDFSVVEVGAGVSLQDLESDLLDNFPEYSFPVDPTEWSASFGGMASTNASGARSFFFSSVRDWVLGIEVVLVDGTVLNLTRGKDKLDGLSLKLNGQVYALPEITKPATKNSIGYFCNKNCDLVDLFIGAEGTLGVITKLKLKLAKRNNNLVSILQFFKTPQEALKFISLARESLKGKCLSLEFLDSKSISIALEAKSSISDQIDNFVSSGFSTLVFSEYKYETETEMEELLQLLEEVISNSGGSFENSVCGLETTEILAIKKFRHAVPEGINRIIAERKRSIPELRKVATDMAVPDEYLFEVYNLYEKVLKEKGLEFSIVGHAGNNHFHVNLLPRSKEEMEIALGVYEILANEIVKMGGAVSAEHGIGRIKTKFLPIQYSNEILDGMRSIKKIFDPEFRLNPGVLLIAN